MNKKSTTASRAFFHFTKKERRGIYVILTAISVIIAAQYCYPLIINDSENNSSDISEAIALLKEKRKDSTQNNYREYDYENQNYHRYERKSDGQTFSGEKFYFDPNTLDAAGWRRLGVKEKTIATIQKYLSKGGKFREPADLRKVWGLREEEKERLVKFARIKDAGSFSGDQYPKSYSSNYIPYEKKEYEKKVIQPVDVNNGDSLSFVSLPGIGPGFSKRIINFRSKLGGFYKVEQVGETFGLPDSVFQKIRPLLRISGDNIRRININTATNDELKAHPYIRWQLANVISEYKKQHGNFNSLSDLKKIMIITDEVYDKIVPYLSL